jgi:hypothetical protein
VQQELGDRAAGRHERHAAADLGVGGLPLVDRLVEAALQQGEFTGEEELDGGVRRAGGEVSLEPREVGLVDDDLPHRLLPAAYVPDSAVEPHHASVTRDRSLRGSACQSASKFTRSLTTG